MFGSILQRNNNNETVLNGSEIFKIFKKIFRHCYMENFFMTSKIDSAALMFPFKYGSFTKTELRQVVIRPFWKFKKLDNDYADYIDERLVCFCLLARNLHITVMFCSKWHETCKTISPSNSPQYSR